MKLKLPHYPKPAPRCHLAVPTLYLRHTPPSGTGPTWLSGFHEWDGGDVEMRDEAAVSRQRLLAAFLRLYRSRDVDFIAGETITYGDQGEVGGQGPRSNRDAANPQAVRQYPRSGGNAQPDRGAARIL